MAAKPTVVPPLKQVRIPVTHRDKAVKAAAEQSSLSWVVFAFGVDLALKPENAAGLARRLKKYQKTPPGPAKGAKAPEPEAKKSEKAAPNENTRTVRKRRAKK